MVDAPVVVAGGRESAAPSFSQENPNKHTIEAIDKKITSFFILIITL